MDELDHIEGLILNYVSGEATDSERIEVREWILASPSNQREFERIAALFQSKSETFDTEKAWLKMERKMLQEDLQSYAIKKRPNLWLSAAAAVIILVGITIFFQIINGNQTMESMATNQPISVQLQDASVVQLNKGGKLTYPEEFKSSKREVELEGEGFFDIQRDTTSPFIIETNYGYVKVLGTSFIIDVDDVLKTTTVQVVSGKVAISKTQDFEQATVLLSGETGRMKMDQMPVKEVQPINSSSESWIAVSLNFNNETVAEAIDKIEFVNGQVVTLENSNIGNCTITADFTGANTELTLEIISETLGLEYERTDEGYILTGEGCE